jgi:hypothetical protein
VKKEKVVGKGKVVPPVKGKAKVEETKSADKSKNTGVGKGKDKVTQIDKGKAKEKETKSADKPKNTGVGKGKDKVTQINKDTVYLEDVVKPRLDFTYSDWVCI